MYVVKHYKHSLPPNYCFRSGYFKFEDIRFWVVGQYVLCLLNA